MLQYAHAYLTFAEIVLSDAFDRGITVTEISAMDQPIDAIPETTAAFVGRALRGPLNTPVLVRHFGDFRRVFGDSWARSSLGPAVRQYFDHGGLRLYVVRVANNAQGALVCLPARSSTLVLRAVDPGSTECIRAAVDYDGIDVRDRRRFNLTLQRIERHTGRILDQEIFRGLSAVDGDERFVADRLANADIARVEAPYPEHRPEATVDNSGYEAVWVGHSVDGTDGSELTDYDLIGSRTARTGLFALDDVEHFDVLYLPAKGKGVDAGPAAVLAAELYCRQRGAMLIVDPTAAAGTPQAAVDRLGALGYASANLVTYYPRLYDRSDAEPLPRAAGGAIAGLLCKLDRRHGPWQPLTTQGIAFDRSMSPARPLTAADVELLTRAGVNAITTGAGGRAGFAGDVTLARGTDPHRVFSQLAIRRTCQSIINSIDLATRWAVFEPADDRLDRRLTRQISAYFDDLYAIGALAAKGYVVECDAGVARYENRIERGVTILLVFHPAGSEQAISFTLHQTVSGCRVASTAFAPIAQHCA